MGSHLLRTRENQKARYQRLFESRLALLKEKGLPSEAIAKDQQVKHLKAKLKQINSAIRSIEALQAVIANRIKEKNERIEAAKSAPKKGEKDKKDAATKSEKGKGGSEKSDKAAKSDKPKKESKKEAKKEEGGAPQAKTEASAAGTQPPQSPQS